MSEQQTRIQQLRKTIADLEALPADTQAMLIDKLTGLREELTTLVKAEGDGATAVGPRGVHIDGNLSGITITGDNNSVNTLLPLTADLNPDQLRTEVGRYLHWVRTQNRTITLRGVEHDGRSVINLDLETVYVPLAATVRPDPTEAQRPDIAHMREQAAQTEIELSRVLGQGRRLIVTGGPGSGKTTVLMHIAWVLADALARDDRAFAADKLGLDAALPLPIFVPINRYANHRRSDAVTKPRQRTLAAFISNYLIERQTSLSLPADFFRQLLRHGRRVILLLDGLDEVPNEEERIEVTQAIDDLVAARPELRVVVTCRSAAYKGRVALGHAFREIRVQPMAAEHIAAMIRQAYRAVEPHRPDRQEQLAADLLAGIEQMEAERKARLGKQADRLVGSPLLVRMLLLVHLSDRELPQQRAELYKKAVDNMITPDYARDVAVRKETAYFVGDPARHRELMQYVAFEMHQQGETQGREIDELDLRRILGRREALEPLTDRMIATTRQRGTLMEERLGTYRFIHLAFQEFLVARHMVEDLLFDQKLAAFVKRTGCLTDSWWREPLLLLAGYLSTEFVRRAEEYIRYLAGLGPVAANRPLAAQWAGAELAGTAVLEWPAAPDRLRRDVAQRLADVVTEPDPGRELSHALRAQAGRVLSQLGDPRPGVGVDKNGVPDIAWGKTVPVGSYTIGDKDPKYSDEKRRDVEIALAYQLARYPVTYVQFQAFVEADDYSDECWWRGMPDGRQELKEQAFQYANHPRERVSWYQVVAFCRWLSHRLGYEVTLPHEYEWEVAARYSDGRKYPWGDEFVAEKANTRESGIGQTTAVGLYPAGRQPELDLYDMSGNVREWCLNKRQDPTQVGVDDSGDTRALRGGSWDFDLDSARAASRLFGGNPNNRNLFRGFRVSRRSPSHVH